MNARIDVLRSYLAEKTADAILLTSPISIHYYTSFSGFALDEREGFALVTKKNVYLLTSKLYEGAVQSLTNITPYIYSSDQPFTPLLKELLSKNEVLSLGVEANNLTLAEYIRFKKLVKIVPLQIRSLRMKKTADEITKIKKACQIADLAFEKVIPQIKAGMTEKQIASFLENEIRDLGATISFRPIVAFGKNAAIPHHLTSDSPRASVDARRGEAGQRLKTNDLVLIDFGAKVDGYCSDMTRTFFHGNPTDEQKRVYNVVLQAQKKAIDYLNQELQIMNQGQVAKDSPRLRRVETGQRLKTGSKRINAKMVDQIARKYIETKGYPSIPHSLGHGIGLEVHEPPYLGPGSKDILEEGMVFSIEPGIYLSGKFGVRIEDLFTIKNNKLIRLTASPKL